MENSDGQLERADVVVVPFPYTDRASTKRRPALVISNGEFHNAHQLVWVAMITSAKNAPWPSDIELPLEGTGLTALSVIRMAKITTIDRAQVLRVAGRVDDKTMTRVSAAVASFTSL